MKDALWESTGIQPLRDIFTRFPARSGESEEFGLSIGSSAFSEEDIRERVKIAQATQAVQVTVTVPSDIWNSTAAFSSLVTENVLLWREIDRIKRRLAELEKAIPREEVIILREISREQAKQEIWQLFSGGQTLYYSEIAEELRLDLELVVDICRELQESGQIKIDESAL